MTVKILCITHADFESPGIIETWALEKGFNFNIVCPYKGDYVSGKNDFDLLIVMGGPQSPLDVEKAPYLLEEIKLIQEAITDNKWVIGFCLGAQLIGDALGARTLRSPEKEIGVYPITLTNEGLKDPLLQGFSQLLPVIHWHNDMPGLTKESIVLAYSEGCPRQIIRYKKFVYGFQCHLEITHEGIKTMIEAVPEDLKPSKYTQNSAELLQHDYNLINQTMVKILERLMSIKYV